MNEQKEAKQNASEPSFQGLLHDGSVKIGKKEHMDELAGKGFGTLEENSLNLTLYEALYLLDKGLLEVEESKGKKMDFRTLLQRYEDADPNAWTNYLTYRDLRSRGYVVREGFGSRVNFRVYERGDYRKNDAKYLMITVAEGRPIAVSDLANSSAQSISLKKELVMAVMNRRGEVVYYTVSELNLK